MPSSKRCETYIKERFGVEKILREYNFVERSGDYWIIPENMEVTGEYITTGIRALRDTGVGLKPTTYFLQVVGEDISKNVFKLDRTSLKKMVFEREKIRLNQCEDKVENGYVALEFMGEIIGCGLKKNDGLVTQIPKGRAKILEELILD